MKKEIDKTLCLVSFMFLILVLNIFVVNMEYVSATSFCGDGTCDSSEDVANCFQDCSYQGTGGECGYDGPNYLGDCQEGYHCNENNECVPEGQGEDTPECQTVDDCPEDDPLIDLYYKCEDGSCIEIDPFEKDLQEYCNPENPEANPDDPICSIDFSQNSEKDNYCGQFEDPQPPECGGNIPDEGIFDPCKDSKDACCTYREFEDYSISSYTSQSAFMDRDEVGFPIRDDETGKIIWHPERETLEYKLSPEGRKRGASWNNKDTTPPGCCNYLGCTGSRTDKTTLKTVKFDYFLPVKDVRSATPEQAFIGCEIGICDHATCLCTTNPIGGIISAEKIDPRTLEEGKDYYIGDKYLYRYVEDIAFNNEHNSLKVFVSDLFYTELNLYYLDKDGNKINIHFEIMSKGPDEALAGYEQAMADYDTCASEGRFDCEVPETPVGIEGYFIISFDPAVEEYPVENFTLYVEDDLGNRISVTYDYVCKKRDVINYTITDETSINQIATQTGLTKEEIESFNTGKTILFAPYSTISLPEEIISLSGKIKYESSKIINDKRIFYEDNFCSKEKKVIKVENVKENYDFSTLEIKQYLAAEELYADLNTFSVESKMTAFFVRDSSDSSTNGLAYLLKGDDYLDELSSSIGVSIYYENAEIEGNNPSLYALTSKEIAENCVIEIIAETGPLDLDQNYSAESVDERMNLIMPYDGIVQDNLNIQIVLIKGSKEGKKCPVAAEEISSTYPEDFYLALNIWGKGGIRLSKILDFTKQWVK